MMRVTFLGFGEVGAAFAAALVARGAAVTAYDVLLETPDGLDRLRARATGIPVRFLPLPEALTDARYVLSTVTTTVAEAAARRCVPHLRTGQTYVDLNATDSTAKRAVAAIVAPSCAGFVEGAILGAIGVTGARTEILLGGPHARAAERDLAGELGLNARFYSEETGQASLFKMLRSVFSKGLEALLLEFLVAAERAGLREDLWREVTTLMANQPFEKTAANWVRTHATAHARRFHEVQQVAEVLRGLGVEPVMTAATEALFQRSQALGFPEKFGTTPPSTMDEMIRFLDARLPR